MLKSCRSAYFFVSLCVKNKIQKRTPTTCKGSTNNGLKQVLGQISSLIHAKCKDWQIKLEGMYQTDASLVVTVSSRGHTASCPCCGHKSSSVHSYRPRKLQDLEFLGKEVILQVKARHFRCSNPGCNKKTFAEPLRMASPYMRTTHDVYERIRHESLNQPAASAVRTLSYQHIRTSASTCHRLVRRIGTSNPEVHTSGYVGIDDFAKKKGHVYACEIVDHYTRDTLAVFDSRYGSEISDWLSAHPEIKLVTRDGSQSYADIITAASPDIVQVSDRFHLIKNLRDTAVDLVKDLMGRKKQKVEYPYPTEEEAYSLILDDMLSMGEEKHRARVREYYQIRKLKDEGKSVAEISRQLDFTPQKVYKRLHTDISKVLSGDQMKVLSHARRMAHIIASRKITSETVCKHLDGALSSTLVHRCMRSVTRKYSELRKDVRDSNESRKEKAVKVSKSAIWNYMLTGKTTSKKLLLLSKTHPHVAQVMDICIHFCNMIHDKEGAPDVYTWIKEAEGCKYSKIYSFAQYIKNDAKAVEQAYLTNFSNALLEGNVNRAKAIKRSMYNRAGIAPLRAKMIYQGRTQALKFCT